jgi:NAD(P)-dependent dehydrogenase (short-subunit alcohol dehydrogenase family)
VLITGAAGNLGQKLRKHLEAGGGYELTLLDRRPADMQQVISADLSTYAENWVRRFRGQDVLVHLAAVANPWVPWASLQKDNVDVLLNVFRAAVENRVKRVVFASTGRAFRGYTDRRVLVRHDFLPRPVEFYGATKIFGERLGQCYADWYGLSVICLRIGVVWPGDNSPLGKRYDTQQIWLSNRDFCQAAEKAINVPDVRFAALFVTSDNEGNPRDLSETRRVLGYDPQDRAVPVKPSLWVRLGRRVFARLRRWSRGLVQRNRRSAVF